MNERRSVSLQGRQGVTPCGPCDEGDDTYRDCGGGTMSPERLVGLCRPGEEEWRVVR